jgi:xanthine dehydrogenase accessory factor
MPQSLSELKIIIKGAGEMATGVASRLHRAGFTRLLLTEIDKPLAVRRTVSFCEVVHDGVCTVEGLRAERIDDPEQAAEAWQKGIVPVLIDPACQSRNTIRPDVLVDAILAKINTGTNIGDAPLVIGLGPGFHATGDVHCVVETNRGHDLGRLILEGPASPNTGTPGVLGGQAIKRVLRAPRAGVFQSDLEIGTMVHTGQIVAHVDGTPVTSALDGVLRGLIRPGTLVPQAIKVGDVDPRGDPSYCHTISEKARAIGGAVLEAVLMKFNVPG